MAVLKFITVVVDEPKVSLWTRAKDWFADLWDDITARGQLEELEDDLDTALDKIVEMSDELDQTRVKLDVIRRSAKCISDDNVKLRKGRDDAVGAAYAIGDNCQRLRQENERLDLELVITNQKLAEYEDAVEVLCGTIEQLRKESKRGQKPRKSVGRTHKKK